MRAPGQPCLPTLLANCDLLACSIFSVFLFTTNLIANYVYRTLATGLFTLQSSESGGLADANPATATAAGANARSGDAALFGTVRDASRDVSCGPTRNAIDHPAEGVIPLAARAMARLARLATPHLAFSGQRTRATPGPLRATPAGARGCCVPATAFSGAGIDAA